MPDLILNIPAFQENELPNRPSDQKPGVTRKQDSPLTGSEFQKLVITEAIGIQNVEARDAQPFRQFAKHDVGDKTGK
jgi:hypothetical protein